MSPKEASSTNWSERITVDPPVLVGKPIVKGTRTSVEFIIDLLAHGWTGARVLDEYDHLAHEDIQACLAYAGDLLRSEGSHSLPDARVRSGRAFLADRDVDVLSIRDDWPGHFAVITDDRVRLRRLPGVPPDRQGGDPSSG